MQKSTGFVTTSGMKQNQSSNFKAISVPTVELNQAKNKQEPDRNSFIFEEETKEDGQTQADQADVQMLSPTNPPPSPKINQPVVIQVSPKEQSKPRITTRLRNRSQQQEAPVPKQLPSKKKVVVEASVELTSEERRLYEKQAAMIYYAGIVEEKLARG